MMTVIAFVERSSIVNSTLQYAAWAAKTMQQPLTLVAMVESSESDSSLIFDAYHGMDVREDMLRELIAAERIEDPMANDAAIELVQEAARSARELGVERVRTTTTSETLAYYIENFTDSDDLLVFGKRSESDQLLGLHMDEILRVRNRVMLLVPESFAPVNSWLIALDGNASCGRAVEYLSRNRLLQDTPGMAAIVGSDHQHRLHFRDAVRHLQSASHTITAHELQGSVDDVLAAIMAVSPVDMLVMGAYGQGRFRSFFERSTTSKLLRIFEGPVLVARA